MKSDEKQSKIHVDKELLDESGEIQSLISSSRYYRPVRVIDEHFKR